MRLLENAADGSIFREMNIAGSYPKWLELLSPWAPSKDGHIVLEGKTFFVSAPPGQAYYIEEHRLCEKDWQAEFSHHACREVIRWGGFYDFAAHEKWLHAGLDPSGIDKAQKTWVRHFYDQKEEKSALVLLVYCQEVLSWKDGKHDIRGISLDGDRWKFEVGNGGPAFSYDGQDWLFDGKKPSADIMKAMLCFLPKSLAEDRHIDEELRETMEVMSRERWRERCDAEYLPHGATHPMTETLALPDSLEKTPETGIINDV